MESKTNKVQLFLNKMGTVLVLSLSLVIPLRRYNKTNND